MIAMAAAQWSPAILHFSAFHMLPMLRFTDDGRR